MKIFTLIFSLLFGFSFNLGVAGAATNCDSQPKPALECPSGYSVMCIPVGGDHWGCGKEINGVITEVSSDGSVTTISSSNSASITSEVEAEASTGGNSVSSGGSMSAGSSKSSVSVTNSRGSDDETEIEIEAENGVSSVKVKSSGFSTSSSSKDDDEDEDLDDEDGIEVELEEEHGKFFLKVNGEEIRVPDNTGALKIKVRGWDFDKKEVTITPKEVKTGSDLENFVKVIALSDDNIVNVLIGTTTVELDYSHGARLFGLFPSTLTPTITLQNEAGTTTEVRVRFPWYHVFFKKDIDFSEVEEEFERASAELETIKSEMNRIAFTLQTISSILKTKHDTVKNSIGNIR